MELAVQSFFVILVAGACVLPGCIKRGNHWIIISGQGKRVLEAGTNVYPPPSFDFAYSRIPPEQLRQQVGRKEGLVSFILRHPKLFLERSALKLADFFAPNSFLIRHVYLGYYGPANQIPWPVRQLVVYVSMISILLLLLGGTAGAFAMTEFKDFSAPDSSLRMFFVISLVFVISTLAMIIVGTSMSRYRLPVMLPAVVFGSGWLSTTFSRELPAWTMRHRIALSFTIAILCLFWCYRIPLIVKEAW